MNTSKKEQKIKDKNEEKIQTLNQQIDDQSRDQEKELKNEDKLKLDKEFTEIKEHCILKAVQQNEIVITLDGWSQGFNNILIWNINEFSEKQRISFSKSNKISDVCLMKENKNVFFFGGDDKYLRIYINQAQDESSLKCDYQEVFSLKLKNKINCIKQIDGDMIFIGAKNGSLHQIHLENIIKLNQKQDKELIDQEKKIDVKINQKEITLHDRKVNDIFVYKNTYLISIGEDKEKSVSKQMQQSCIRCGYLAENKSNFYTGNTGGQVIIYNLETFQEFKKIEMLNYIYCILQVDINDSEYFMCATNKKKWHLYSLTQNSIVQESITYNDYISQLILLSDNTIFLGEGKNLFQVWKSVNS